MVRSSSAVRIWKRVEGDRWRNIASLPDPRPRFSQGARFSADGRFLAVAGSARLQLFDMESGKRLHELELEPPERQSGPLPVGVEFSADGKRVHTIGHAFRTWDRQTGEKLEEVPLGIDHSKKDPAYFYGTGLWRSPDGERLAVRVGDKPLRIYRIRS